MTVSTPDKVQSVSLGDGRSATPAVATTPAPPGDISTNTDALRADRDRHGAILGRIPAGRWAVPTDPAGSTVFLATRASDYVPGALPPVDGGRLGR